MVQECFYQEIQKSTMGLLCHKAVGACREFKGRYDTRHKEECDFFLGKKRAELLHYAS